MDTGEAMGVMDGTEKKLASYAYAMGILQYDGETVAPPASVKGRGGALALLSGEYHAAFTDPRFGEALEVLCADGSLDAPAARRAALLREEHAKSTRIPAMEFIEFSVARNESQQAWIAAKAASDFGLFKPWLEKMIGFARRFAGYYDSSKSVYDALLSEYEKNLSVSFLDPFFKSLADEIVPLITRIAALPAPDDSFLRGDFPEDLQRRLAPVIMEVMGLPKDSCVIGESEHPFTTGLARGDTRITTHYHRGTPVPALFSTLHESGHALYEVGANPEWEGTIIGVPRIMSLHESQSRFFENCIARSAPFCSFLLARLRELFPGLSGVGDREFYRAVNKVSPSLIRIEADELTYSVHIMIRYEMEKLFFLDGMDAADAPGEWNRLYRERLGVDVPDDARGILQDTHWAGGMFGYFPSYALGSAYAAQFLHAIEKDVDWRTPAASGDLSAVRNWLASRLHFKAGYPEADEALVGATGEAFNPARYTDYLKEKFAGVYGV